MLNQSLDIIANQVTIDQNQEKGWQRYSSHASSKGAKNEKETSLDYVAQLPQRHKRRVQLLPELYQNGVVNSMNSIQSLQGKDEQHSISKYTMPYSSYDNLNGVS